MNRHDESRDRLLGHEADGIREFDNALPRWWLYGFYFTIVFGAGYFINYHVLSTPLWGQPGQAAEYQAEMEDARRAYGDRRASGVAAGLAALTDADSLAKGEAIFMGQRSLCHTCHRKDLGGLIGPNLTDTMWMHGCSVGEMVKNVSTGFPTRGMLPFGSSQPLTDEELLQVVSFVVAKRGTNPANPKAVDPEREKECR